MPAPAHAIGYCIILAQCAAIGIHVAFPAALMLVRGIIRCMGFSPVNALRATLMADYVEPCHVVIREILMPVDQSLNCRK